MVQLISHLSMHSWLYLLPDGVASSALASIGTGIGAFPVLFAQELSDRWRNHLLSVGAGIMLASAGFSLVWPALELASHLSNPTIGWVEVVCAFCVGALLIYGLEAWFPASETSEGDRRQLWLFVLAIALHHFPEGLAVGLVMTANQDFSLAIGVGLQNLPEGLMVALACRELGYGVRLSVLMATLSGWLEPLGGLTGGWLANGSVEMVPIGMALAAGAMLFVILHELLPSLNIKSLTGANSMGLVTGLAVMGLIKQVVG
ncbi:MAG: ZIP family metal transporter [Cyanobacteria bacterium P01_F01_bin.150]